MATTKFDDGSSISWDDSGNVSSTPSPEGMQLFDHYSSNFNPGNLNAGANSAMDLLKFGIGRVADYKTAKLTAQNTQPNYVQPLAQLPGSLNTSTVLLLAGAALVFLLVSGGKG